MLAESYLLYGYGYGYGLSRARVAEAWQRSGWHLVLIRQNQVLDIKG